MDTLVELELNKPQERLKIKKQIHANNNPNQPKGQGRKNCSKTINKNHKF